MIGDAAVPALLSVAKDDAGIDKISIYDALVETGIPMHQFQEAFYKGDISDAQIWWKKNQASTLSQRTQYRDSIGLPPPDVYDQFGNVMKLTN